MKRTGELELFKKIWNERPHYCEVTGLYLPKFEPILFSHILSKGAYPKFRLYEPNIMLVHPMIHRLWEFEPREKNLARFPAMKIKYDKKDELKILYNNTL